MQNTHRNILIALVVGVAVVGGVMASSGDLFQGKLKVPPKIVNCEDKLIFDSNTDDFQDFYDEVERDIGADGVVECPYSFKFETFYDGGEAHSVSYVCGGNTLQAVAEDNAIRCDRWISNGSVQALLTLAKKEVRESLVFGVDVRHNMHADAYIVERVPRAVFHE